MATNNAINAPFPFTVAQGGTGLATLTAHAILVGEGTSNISPIGPLTNGQFLIGSTGADPVAASITAGTGISVTPGAGSVTIAATSSGTPWTNVTGTSQAMAVNNGYVANNASLVTLTLPSTFAVGAVIEVQGSGAGGWLIAQNSGQSINFGSAAATTTGVSGSLASSNRYDAVTLIGITANTVLAVQNAQGNLTIV